jgi:hypothetical protein
MENGTISQGDGRDPSSFLSEIIGNPVTVKLNSGVVYKGALLPNDLAAVECGESFADVLGFRRAAVCRWLYEYRAGEV